MIEDKINKYMVEGKMKGDVKSLVSFISKPKTTKFSTSDGDINVTVAGDMIIFKYDSSNNELTYNLIQASDKMKLKYQQIGMRSENKMKFMIDIG